MQPTYIASDRPLHRWHPLTKMALAFFFIVAVSLAPWPYTPALVCLLVGLLALLGGIAGRLFRAALLFLLPIGFSLFVIQGLLFPPTRVTPIPLGPVTIWREGLIFAALSCVRILALISSIMLVVQSTHPADLTYALTERGLPSGIGYILLVALQLAPDMSARATAIQEAQQSRGLETKGPIRRLRALPSLVGPLVVGALVDVEERAMALESRAYTAPGRKTSLRQLTDTTSQRVARIVLLLGVLAVIGWRVATLFQT
jgi:energy-coupling factor transport system permease protein